MNARGKKIGDLMDRVADEIEALLKDNERLETQLKVTQDVLEMKLRQIEDWKAYADNKRQRP